MVDNRTKHRDVLFSHKNIKVKALFEENKNYNRGEKMNKKIILGVLIWLVGFFFSNVPLALLGVLLIFLGSLKKEKN
jgi:hypothetical protein